MKKRIGPALVAGLALAVAPAASGEDAYIESDGTQGLVTGYCVTTNSRIELDFQLVDVGGQYRLFSSGPGNIGSNTTNLQCDCYVSGTEGTPGDKFSFYYTKANGTQKGHNFHPADTNRHTIVVDFTAASQQFQVWTGGKLTRGYNCEPPFLNNGRSTVPIALFCKNYNEYAMSFGRYAKAKIYGFKAYEAGTLVMELVPWVKGGMAGFKDTCTERFHSIESTQSCKVGGNVTEEKDDPYISSIINTNGIYVSDNRVAGKSICLDTGYTITPNTRVELDCASLAPNWSSSKLYKASPWLLGAYNVDANDVTQQVYVCARGTAAAHGYYCWKIGSSAQVNESQLPITRAYGVRRTFSFDSSIARFRRRRGHRKPCRLYAKNWRELQREGQVHADAYLWLEIL